MLDLYHWQFVLKITPRGDDRMISDKFEDTNFGTNSVTLVENVVARGNDVLQDELQE